jgi:hypothetical protein
MSMFHNLPRVPRKNGTPGAPGTFSAGADFLITTYIVLVFMISLIDAK